MSQAREVCSVRDRTRGTSYNIVVQPDLHAEVGATARALTRSSKIVVVSDEVVAPLYLPGVLSSLQAAGFEVLTALVPAGENHKTIQTIASIYDQVLPRGIDRATPLLALGGGVIGDMAGFAAATLLRGIPFIQCPTTLLAMVDASVGGKTGVDHAMGKNLLGAFHQPIAVLIDPLTLKTLPARELRSGLAECIKHEIIRDAEGFASLERDIERALALDMEYLTKLIAHNVAIKARVVEADPFEKGERAHLNFGHTFGHAIETVKNYSLAHGECVALGTTAASRMAVALGMLDASSCDRIVRLIRRAGLPTELSELDVEAVCRAMLFDKKVRGGKVRFVLPERIGDVVIRDDIPEEQVRAQVDALVGSARAGG